MNDPREKAAEEANSRLTEGLKACRSILSNYRAMIAGRRNNNHSQPEGSAEEA
jgi:hypothetical protein